MSGQDARQVLPLPVGIAANGRRSERGSPCSVEVRAGHHRGARTQRSRGGAPAGRA
jgi:hypothetical protein